MTSRSIIALLTVGTALLLAAPVEAGGGKKAGKGNRASARFLSRFDRNQDGKIDGQEAERLRSIYSSLYALDTNHDGQLSDPELAAVKVEPAPAKKAAGGGKKAAAKAQAPASSTSQSQSQAKPQ